jgi:hypothetical protein
MLSQVAAASTNTSAAQTTIPYVPTRHDIERDLLWMADVGTNDVVYDLGSGDGRLAATYVDLNRTVPVWAGGNKPIPVTDLYDFGGGFYFTLLLGLEGTSLIRGGRIMGPENGWLIGEAVTQDNTLRGTIAFYPYSTTSQLQPLDRKPPPQQGRRDWQPKRVAP